MVEFLLKEQIERRVKEEVGADKYFSETVVLKIETGKVEFQLENAIYFLISKSIDTELTARISISSPDNFFPTSKKDYDNYSAHNIQSFRNKLKVITDNNGLPFTDYVLEFLKVTPMI